MVAMSHQGKPLYHRHLEHLVLPGGDMQSGIRAGGFEIRVLSLDEYRFQISFDDPTAPLQFNFVWQGVHEPADSVGRVPGGVAGLSNMHIEQMGRISGDMKYRDQDLISPAFAP